MSNANTLLMQRFARSALVQRVHFQIADRCNHTCVHCYQIQGQKGELTTEQVKAALDRMAASGAFFVTFSGGEATLRADLFELIAHARSLHILA